MLADGAIQILSGLFPIEQARSLDTWNVTGMCATGSTDYEFDGVMVAEDWTFEPFRPRVLTDDDVFSAIPLWAQLGGLAACAVGAARNMIDRFRRAGRDEGPHSGISAGSPNEYRPRSRSVRPRACTSRRTPRSWPPSKPPGRAASPASRSTTRRWPGTASDR